MSPPSSAILHFSSNFFLILYSFLFISCSAVQRYGTSGNNADVMNEETKKTEKDFTESEGSYIRLLLNNPSEDFSFTAEDNMSIMDDNNASLKISRGEAVKFSENKGVILFGKSESKYYTIKSADNFKYNNKKYTGEMQVVTDGMRVHLINTLPIEEYLKGVVPSEMPLGQGDEYFEGLKAFSICARTYAINRMLDSKSLFDVRVDVSDQVYGGTGRRQAISDLAVDETEGMILIYDDRPARIFYSSTCGGITEAVENVFKIESVPYLESLKDGSGPYCSISPRITWEEKFTGERIISLLERAKKISNKDYVLTDIHVNSRFASGRINELEITLKHKSEGTISVKLYGNNIRFVLLSGSNQTLNSNNFEIINRENTYTFRGKGWGHGVGLCQWGALAQSAQGIRYEQILEHYFPGTELTGYNGKN